MTNLPDMQQAVNEVDGVAAATMRWPEPEGPAFMRIEFDAGADEGAVAERVLEVLRQAAGVDTRQLVEQPGQFPAEPPQANAATEPDSRSRVQAGPDSPQMQTGSGPSQMQTGPGPSQMQPDFGEAGPREAGPRVAEAADPREQAAYANGHAGKEAGHAPWSVASDAPSAHEGHADNSAPAWPPPEHARMVIERVTLDRARERTTVEVSLELEGRVAGGRAGAPAHDGGNARIAAEATLAAVHTLLPARLDLRGVATVEDRGPTPLACVWLRRLTDSGQQHDTVGSAIIREEPAEATVRATLDALNRWIPVLRGQPSHGHDGLAGRPTHPSG